MSEIVLPLIEQIVIMFVLSAIGFIMYRTGKITMDGNKAIANILIYLSLPCVIINGFMVDRTPERVQGLILSAIAAVVVLILASVIAHLFFKEDSIAKFAATFSNPGFFGVPIIIETLGNDHVFYIAAFIAFLNLLQWTYGVSILTGKKGAVSVKSILTAPFMIAIMIGLAVFLSEVSLPHVVTRSIEFIAGLNTPLAMFSIGVYLAQVDLKKMFLHKKLYLIALVRQVIIPLAALVVLSFLPSSMQVLKLPILIAAACPVGSNVAVYAQLHNCDYGYAVEAVVISTILAVGSMPLIISLA